MDLHVVNIGERLRSDPSGSKVRPLTVCWLGRLPYHRAVQAMRSWTDRRSVDTSDELWLLEHPPVFTLGQAGRRRHVRDPGAIPVVRADRGGQVTYHGPGQLVAYLLFDLRRAKFGVRRTVENLEQAVVETLNAAAIRAARLEGAPGVYVGSRKIASVGLRVSNGRTFHGISINVDLDLSPFVRIDPCGYAAHRVTRLVDLEVRWSVQETGRRFAVSLGRRLDREIVWDRMPHARPIAELESREHCGSRTLAMP